MRPEKVWISLLILVVIALHAFPVLSYQGFRQTRWPLLAWAMYAKSVPPGPVETFRKRIVAVTARGERVTLSPHLVGVSRPTLGSSYVRPLWSGDSAKAQELFLRLNRGRTDPIFELRAEGERYSVSDTGIVKEALPTITYRLTASSPR